MTIGTCSSCGEHCTLHRCRKCFLKGRMNTESRRRKNREYELNVRNKR